MAQFRVDGRTYAASRESWKVVAPKLSTYDLEQELCDLGRFEIRYGRGEVQCSDEDWGELTAIATDIFNELGLRYLFSECGITLEVR